MSLWQFVNIVILSMTESEAGLNKQRYSVNIVNIVLKGDSKG